MADLAPYGGTVLAAYGVTAGLLCALVLYTLWRGRKASDLLETATKSRGNTDD